MLKTWSLKMEHNIIVESAGVDGISSKIATFKVNIIISGKELKIEDGKLYQRSCLNASYKAYDDELGPSPQINHVRLLKNCVSTEEIYSLIDEYCGTVLFEDDDKLLSRIPCCDLGENKESFSTSEALKTKLLNEINQAYANFIDTNFIG